MLSKHELQQAETLRQAGYTAEQVLNILRPQKTVEEKTFVQDAFSDIKETGKALAETAQKAADDVSATKRDYQSGKIGLLRAVGQVAGRGAGAGAGFVGDIAIGAGKTVLTQSAEDSVAEGVQKAITPIATSDTVQSAISYFDSLDPTTQRDLKAVLGVAELATLGGVGVGAKVATRTAVNSAKNAASKVTTAVKNDLREVFKATDVDSISDTVLTGAADVAKRVQKIPEKIGETVKASVDRKNIQLALNSPAKAKELILDLYKRGIVPGVKAKKKTVKNVDKINKSVKRAIPDLAKKYDVEDTLDFAKAISSEKKHVYAQINKLIDKATDKELTVNLDGLVAKLDELAEKEIAQFSPELRKAIDKARDIFVDKDGAVKTISPSGAEDLIVRFNSELDAFYKGRATGTGADVEIKEALVRVLREEVDGTVSKLKGDSFNALKSRYGDLKAMDADVTHRAVFQAQRGQGLAGLTDIFSAGDIAAGAIDPAFLVKGVSQYITKEVTQALSDRDELIRQAFVIGKNLKDEVQVSKGSKRGKSNPQRTKQSSSNDTKESQKSTVDKVGEK